jgi:hypothetical protein
MTMTGMTMTNRDSDNEQGRRQRTTNNDDGDDDDDRQSTHPHADEQLLVGWIVGAPGPYDDEDDKRPRGRQTTNDRGTTNDWGRQRWTTDDDAPPAPSLTSNCS